MKHWSLPFPVLVSWVILLNPGPTKAGYARTLQTVKIQISWLLNKSTDLDLHCLSLSM